MRMTRIDHLVGRLVQELVEKGFKRQPSSEAFQHAAIRFVGIRQQLVDINAFAIVDAQNLDRENIDRLHTDFYTFLHQWRPSFFLLRGLKKTGVICFLFETSSHELIQHAVSQSRDTEEEGLVLVDGARTATWVIDLMTASNYSLDVMLPMFPPAAGYFYPGKTWIKDILREYMETETPTVYLIFRSTDGDFADEVEKTLAKKGIDVIRYDQHVGGGLIDRFTQWREASWHVLLLASNKWADMSQQMKSELNTLTAYKDNRLDDAIYVLTKEDLTPHVADYVRFFGEPDTYSSANMIRLMAKLQEKPQYR